ncbi:MAG: ATP-dependent sacrificial sulfur transferase LarE [Deltaproteobacteria bacterium]|nr:ATP-dependent sacrificial sulfur transferase LarE [Deltaproteobacteria bacterium]
MKEDLQIKRKNLVRYLEGLDSLLVAFSGGVDSTFLLAISHHVLGENAVAATAESIINTPEEIGRAREFTRRYGISHIIFPSEEIENPEFLSNGPDRCYLCKRALSRQLLEIAIKRNIRNIAHAANKDDLNDYRPGLQALEEAGLVAPLIDAGITKQDVRFLSMEMGLSVWDKPSMACLVSRIPYGDGITKEKLKMIKRAERFLLQKGFKQVRVRLHGDTARIEIEKSELGKIIETKMSEAIVKEFRGAGFEHISLDLEGYISGSMNRSLKPDQMIRKR